MNIKAIKKIDFRKQNSWTHAEYEILNRQDELCLGTKHYQGLAWFWAYKYRHVMRDCTNRQRVQIHNALVKAKISLVGETKKHDEIVNRIFCENYVSAA